MAKDPRDRLTECLDMIKTCGGETHLKHIEAMVLTMRQLSANLSLKPLAKGDKPDTKLDRVYLRTIALVEATRTNTLPTKASLEALAQKKDEALEKQLKDLLKPENEDALGPLYLAAGGNTKLPKTKPAHWDPEEEFSFNIKEKKMVAGPQNPRTLRVPTNNVPAHQKINLVNNASGHCKRAWELVRHFRLPEPNFVSLFGGGANAPNFIGGMVRFNNGLELTDFSGHFFMNYTVEAEHTLIDFVKKLGHKFKFFHSKAVYDPTDPKDAPKNGKCPSPVDGPGGTKVCPGHPF